MLKKLACLFLVVLISIDGFAAVVSDNDGSAFVTKSEFEDLKKNFNKQIERYNQSLDNKIDGKIADFLGGQHVSQIVDLKSYINAIGHSFSDSTTLGWPATRTGTYRKWFINLGALYGHMFKKNTTSQLQYLTGSINSAAWKEENTSNYGIYLYGEKVDDNTWKLQNYIYSKPYASVGGIFTSGSSYQTDPTTNVTIPTKTFTNSSSTSFDSSSDTWSPNLGGKTLNINVTKSFGIADTFYDPTLNIVTGNQLSTTDVYFVEAKNLNYPGTTNADMKASAMGWEVRGVDSSTNEGITKIGWTATTANENTKIRIYNHKYETINRTKILNEQATKEFGSNIYYYEGLPIFTNGVDKGSVELKLKFVNSSGSQTVFQIKTKKFGNTAIPTSGYTSDYKEWETKTLIANSGDEIKINLEYVLKDETYWIKAQPLSGGTTTITTTRIRLTTE